jgi:excisionase family DNA binding protein
MSDQHGARVIEPLLSIVEAADVLGISPMSVRRLLERGELQGVRVGLRRRLIQPERLREYLEQSREGGP